MTDQVSCDGTLFDCLRDRNFLTKTNVRMLTSFAQTWRCGALQAIIDTHILTESELANALANIFQLDRIIGLRNHRVDDNCLNLLTYKEAKERVIALFCDDSGRYDLVTADPSDQTYIAGLRKKSPVQFTLAVGERSDIVRAIDEKYPLGAQLPTIIGQ